METEKEKQHHGIQFQHCVSEHLGRPNIRVEVIIKQTHFAYWTKTFVNLDRLIYNEGKYNGQFGQIHGNTNTSADQT